jgi:nitric oxide dioxygenase
MSVTEEQKQLLRSTSYILKDHGPEVASKFFSRLFKEHPEYRNYFNQTNQQTGKQPAAFALTFYTYIQHLDNLDAMLPHMSRISSKHRSSMVKPELYPTLGKYWLQTVKETLCDKGTPEVMAAWQALFNIISGTFVKKEKELYAALEGEEHEKGFLPFTVAKKETVASGPTYAVTLKRDDGGKLWNYNPGQYITVRIEKNGVLHNGRYPLLETYNGSTYTIAFKPGYDTDPNTIISEEIIRNREVGSKVLVSPPAGTFSLNTNAKSHLFISGGIAITSFLAILEDLKKQGKTDSVTLIQCVRTEGHAAFAEKLRGTLAQGHYEILTEQDPISKKHLEGKVNADTHVYLSGSEVFLTMAEHALAGFNVPKSQVHIKSIEPTLRVLKELGKK